MVKQRIIEAQSGAGDIAVGKALGELERVALHDIRKSEAIEAICREVIIRVDGVAELVHITPGMLAFLRESVKNKSKGTLIASPRLQLPEETINAQSAKIRSDWNSINWKSNPPRGWAWREQVGGKGKNQQTQNEIIALVYETKSHPGEAEIFLDKEIFIYPRGALALIKNMNKRHRALMRSKKDKKEKK